jgi:hypothetical protein
MKHKSTPDHNLRIDLAVAILRAVKYQQPVDFTRVAPLFALMACDAVVESFLAKRLDHFTSHRLGTRRGPIATAPLAGLFLTPSQGGKTLQQQAGQ